MKLPRMALLKLAASMLTQRIKSASKYLCTNRLARRHEAQPSGEPTLRAKPL